MKLLLKLVAVVSLLALGIGYVADQGPVDRDGPGRTTDTGKSRLGQ